MADEILADDLLDTMPSQARTMGRTRVFEIDPGAAHAAAESARDERFVCVSPSVGVGMGCLTAVVPAEQASACVAELQRHARAAHGGEPVVGSTGAGRLSIPSLRSQLERWARELLAPAG